MGKISRIFGKIGRIDKVFSGVKKVGGISEFTIT